MSRHPHFTLTVLVFLTAWLTWPAQMARADVAPPPYPAGAAIDSSGTPTQVRMVSEEVTLSVEPLQGSTPQGEGLTAGWMQARVEAEFVMCNLGDVEESFDVWFPLGTPDSVAPLSPPAVIEDFAAWVDGVPAQLGRVEAPGITPWGDYLIHWATWPVRFPVGQDVIIQVSYTLHPTGYRPFGTFEYVLETGAGWQGTIGEATVTIRLPYPVTPENTALDSTSEYCVPRPDGFQVQGNEVVWRFTDLKPTSDDNVRLNVLEPDRWHALVAAREAVAAAPDSAEAQLQLARAARGAVSIKHGVNPLGGGERLAQAASDAYARSLELSPQQNEIHGEYAEWLLWISNRYLSENGTYPEALYDAVARGLEQAPDDERLLQIQEIIASQETQNSTATPTVRPTLPADILLPSPTAVPTASPPPSPTVAPTATPVPGNPSAPGGSLCAGTLLWGLIPLALVGRLWWRMHCDVARSSMGTAGPVSA